MKKDPKNKNKNWEKKNEPVTTTTTTTRATNQWVLIGLELEAPHGRYDFPWEQRHLEMRKANGKPYGMCKLKYIQL